MFKMLLDEPPLIVLPSLAVKVGLNEAIVLQQVHYWMQNAKEARRENNFRNGRWWVYNSYQDWEKTFPFWSLNTIKRTFQDLEKKGLVISACLSAASTDRTKWYTIDYAVYRDLVEPADNEAESHDLLSSAQNEPMERPKMGSSIGPKWAHGSAQIDTLQKPKVGRSIKEAETTTKNTAKNTADNRALVDVTDDSGTGSSAAAAESDEYINSLVQELTSAGVNRSDAERLSSAVPDECRRQLDFLPFVTEFKTSKGAYLRSAIEGGFGPPTGWTKAQEAEEKRRADAERAARAEQKHQTAQASEEQKRRAARDERERIRRDNPAQWNQLEAEAIAMMPHVVRSKPESRAYATTLILNIDRLIKDGKLSQ